MRRNFECPLTGAACDDPDCTATRCHKREQEGEADLRRKTERESRAWQRAKDRREAAGRILDVLAAERRRPSPRGAEREAYIDKLLAMDKYAMRVTQHLDAILAERAGKAERPKRPRRPRIEGMDL